MTTKSGQGMENGVSRKSEFSDRLQELAFSDVRRESCAPRGDGASSSPGQHPSGWSVSVRSALCGCTNLTTHRGRRNNALLILLISIVPVLALVIQNAVNVQTNKDGLNDSVRVKDGVLFSTESGAVVHYMQIERGTSALFISSGGQSGLDSLEDKRGDADRAIASLTRWVGTQADGDRFVSRELFHRSVRDFRRLVTAVNVTVPENVAFYSADIAVMIGWLADSIQLSHSPRLWPTLVSYHMLVVSKEQAGVERALGSTPFQSPALFS